MAGLVAKRYGTAIFELAKEKDAVETLENEIIILEEAFKMMDLKDFLGNPKVPMTEKVTVLESSLSDKISHDLMGLLVLLVEKGRYQEMDKIFEEVLELIDVHHGRVKAYVTSADVLTEDQKFKLIHQLAKETKKEVIPIYEIDESLIGGLIIRIGDRIVDNSIKGHMHSLSKVLMATKIES